MCLWAEDVTDMKIAGIEIIECEEVGDSIFLLPQVHPVAYAAPGQLKPTFQQRMDAVTEAYVQAARRGEVGVIKNIGESK